MLAFLWLLLTNWALGTSFPTAAWETFLKSIDATLPLLAQSNSQICYYLDPGQTCFGQAVGHLLGQSAVDPLTWTPTEAQCSTLLQEQLPYLEAIATDLFGAAITSAAAAGVTDFEILAQSWVLRVGHHALKTDYASFLTAINSISVWTTVHCDGGDLLYDGKTLDSELLGTVECDILDTVYRPPVDCSVLACSVADILTCCIPPRGTVCCDGNTSRLNAFCGDPVCSDRNSCCQIRSTYACCTG